MVWPQFHEFEIESDIGLIKFKLFCCLDSPSRIEVRIISKGRRAVWPLWFVKAALNLVLAIPEGEDKVNCIISDHSRSPAENVSRAVSVRSDGVEDLLPRYPFGRDEVETINEHFGDTLRFKHRSLLAKMAKDGLGKSLSDAYQFVDRLEDEYGEKSGDVLMEKIRKAEFDEMVITIVADTLKKDKKYVHPESRFREDFGVDSLDWHEIVVVLERETDIRIPEEEVSRWEIVKDVQTGFWKQMRKKHREESRHIGTGQKESSGAW